MHTKTPTLTNTLLDPTGLDPFRLTAFEQLTATCKSVVIAAAVLEEHLTPQQAFQASRLEEDAQIEEWGMVGVGVFGCTCIRVI